MTGAVLLLHAAVSGAGALKALGQVFWRMAISFRIVVAWIRAKPR